MSICQQHKDTLILDIFGELDADQLDVWQKHLDNCTGCRDERDSLAGAIQTSKASRAFPPLGEADAAVMRNRVIHDLTAGVTTHRKQGASFFSIKGFVPALATVCVLVVALGLVGSKLLTGPEIDPTPRLSLLREQLPADDIDIITNLDILYSLDDLNKLARAIDQPEPAPPHDNFQGNYGNEEKATLV